MPILCPSSIYTTNCVSLFFPQGFECDRNVIQSVSSLSEQTLCFSSPELSCWFLWFLWFLEWLECPSGVEWHRYCLETKVMRIHLFSFVVLVFPIMLICYVGNSSRPGWLYAILSVVLLSMLGLLLWYCERWGTFMTYYFAKLFVWILYYIYAFVYYQM